MPSLLRKTAPGKWREDDTWMRLGDLPADAFNDLRTDRNALSVWWIEDDKSNLEDVLTALAATGNCASAMKYRLLDPSIMTGLGIEISLAPGDSPFARANGWHRDLTKLTCESLFAIARVLAKCEVHTVSAGGVRMHVTNAINAKLLDIHRMHPALLQSLRLPLTADVKPDEDALQTITRAWPTVGEELRREILDCLGL